LEFTEGWCAYMPGRGVLQYAPTNSSLLDQRQNGRRSKSACAVSGDPVDGWFRGQVYYRTKTSFLARLWLPAVSL